MSGEQGRRPFHRPTLRPPDRLEDAAAGPDPLEVAEAAHRSAELVVGRGRAESAGDSELTSRLVGLVSEVGLATVAQLWSDRPARSLPGALWRLYLLHEWVLRQPEEVGRQFAAGSGHAEVYRAIAGVAEPPDPDGLRHLTEQILGGVFTGDFAIALERASAFCHVMAVGLVEPGGGDIPGEQVTRAARLRDTADDLTACARLWRLGDLH
ncbi:hypothetical protein SGUI_2591 [Serinicoccus hydrothermalis]|uniref:Uncharacterized protein n=1 Tax=Serinicoccus hydrothermalis TaxID=1758689 RepID=A0A1B1NEW8_9MICO|nr:hypothetical protein [Serinicoccus hydrothermalis]ANS79987.1 hypothetical protein SGUI_2591 [Serinicoccus hydrothermalis]